MSTTASSPARCIRIISITCVPLISRALAPNQRWPLRYAGSCAGNSAFKLENMSVPNPGAAIDISPSQRLGLFVFFLSRFSQVAFEHLPSQALASESEGNRQPQHGGAEHDGKRGNH